MPGAHAKSLKTEVLPKTHCDADIPFQSAHYLHCFEQILVASINRPTDDLSQLCHIWRNFLQAYSVSLWMPANAFIDKGWELKALASSEGIDRENVERVVSSHCKNNIIAYTNALNQKVYVSDPATWSETHGGETYNCNAFMEGQHCGFKCLLCVPLTFHRDASTNALPPNAVLCASFNDSFSNASPEQLDTSMLQHQSAQFIATSLLVEHQRILTKMNLLALEYLPGNHQSRPDENRRLYLNNIIQLIQDHLSFNCVSIFYRTSSHDAITALATTGLWQADGNQLPENSINVASYKRGEGLTGTVFENGRPLKFNLDSLCPLSKHKWRETAQLLTDSSTVVLWPILAPAPDVNTNRVVLGVIRLVATNTNSSEMRTPDFDPFQIQILDFISTMLVHVLETMADTIARHRTIAIIKHDLFSPLKMMQDTITHNALRIKAGKSTTEHFLNDLEFCIHTASTLVSVLGQDPTEVNPFNPAPTLLAGNVVAGIQGMLNHYAKAENGMSIRFARIRETFPPLNVDTVLIRRALCNLIINAIKYGNPGTVIDVIAKSDRSGYYIDVINFGIGIENEDTAKIFEEGFRSQKARSSSQGLGMGLALARSIMRRHGGDLILASHRNPTIFSLFFPKTLKTSVN